MVTKISKSTTTNHNNNDKNIKLSSGETKRIKKKRKCSVDNIYYYQILCGFDADLTDKVLFNIGRKRNNKINEIFSWRQNSYYFTISLFRSDV